MTPETLVAIRKQLSLTQGQLGALIGVTEKTMSRWEIGFTPVPAPVAILLLLINSMPAVRAACGIEEKETIDD